MNIILYRFCAGIVIIGLAFNASQIYTKKSHLSMSKSFFSNTSKEIIFVRHGRTEMNEVMDPWGSPEFQDKLLWDTQLSGYGKSQCKLLNKRIRQPSIFSELGNIKRVELIVSSPLSRALDTANNSLENVFDESIRIPKIVLPCASERVYMSSEIGKPRVELKSTYLDWDFSHVPDSPWWFIPEESSSYIEWRPPGVYAIPGEPRDNFIERMKRLRLWIENRPEKCIMVFTHWGVIRALTGLNFENCEIRTINSAYLLVEPLVD